jgi:secreted trypsin-like serine protease
MKLSKIAIITLATLLFTPVPAHAIKDGVSAKDHPRIVALYFKGQSDWNTPLQTCTGFLYSPRIVLTAAHCVHNGLKRPNKVPLKPSMMWIGAPGALTGTTAKRFNVEKIFSQKGFELNNNRVYSYKNDFAVMVLESPLSPVKEAKLATKEEIETYIAEGRMVTTGGYGGTSATDLNQGDPSRKAYPMKASFKLIPFDTGMQSVQERMRMWNRNYYQSDAVSFMRYEEGTAHPCNGDSGSGYFMESNGVFTYLGITWSAVHPLCEKGDPANMAKFKPSSGYVVAFRGIYLDLPLVKKAKDYLKAN